MPLVEKKRSIDYKNISEFSMTVRYVESDPAQPETQLQSHIHNTCEILVHISGDITFNVENNLYPVIPGNIIVTRPYEYHHCIYRSDAQHKHFCIFLEADNNKFLYDLFYDRAAGEKNLLIPSQEDSKKMITLCHEMMNTPQNSFAEYARFFKLMQYLRSAEVPDMIQHPHIDVLLTLSFINAHLAEKITVDLLARQANVSINTLERHLHEMLHMTPSEYLRQKRLAKAMEYLALSNNVSEVCELCGFADTSAFIQQFRRATGVTPLQYKKKLTEKNE